VKIIIPTKKVNEEMLELLEKSLEATSDAVISIFHEPRKSWAQVMKENVKDDDDYLIADDDLIMADKEWYKKLKEYTEKYDVIGFKLFNQDGSIQHFGVYMRNDGIGFHPHQGAKDFFLDKDMEVPAITSSLIFVKKKVLQKIPFVDKMFASSEGEYFETVDFCFRARKAGFKVGVIPVTFVHLGGLTRKQDPLLQEKFIKNAGLFQARWLQDLVEEEKAWQ